MTVYTPTYVPPRSERRMIGRPKEVPDVCVKQAQAVIITENNWNIMARKPFHMTFDSAKVSIPDELKERVPVIDISKLDEALDALVADIVLACADCLTGRFDVQALTDRMMKLGATVTFPATKGGK